MPSLRELRVVTSIHHLLIKFPTPRGIGKVQGDQQESRQCYHQVVKTTSKPRQFHVVDQRPPSEGSFDDSIDPRSLGEEGTTGPIKDLVDLPVDDKEPSSVLKFGKKLLDGVREAIADFLGQNLDVFAWTYSDMQGIDARHKPLPQHRSGQEASQVEKAGYGHRALPCLEGRGRQTPLEWLHKRVFSILLGWQTRPSQEAKWKVEDLCGLHRFK